MTAFNDQNMSAADSEIVTGILYKPVEANEIESLMRECVRGGDVRSTLQKTRHRMFALAG